MAATCHPQKPIWVGVTGTGVVELHSPANNFSIASHVTLWLFGNNYIHITDSK